MKKKLSCDFIIALATLYTKYIYMNISRREIDTDSLALSLGGRVDRAKGQLISKVNFI